MKFPAAILRHGTRLLPLPGRVVRPWLRRIDPLLSYPEPPVVVKVHGGFGRFEIRSFPEYIQRNIYFFGYYEFRESRLVKSLLRPGDTFVDAGANIGWFTLLAAGRVGPQGRVFAFEPSSRIQAHLRRHVELNRLANVRLETCALSNENGTAVLSGISELNAGIGSILPPDLSHGEGDAAGEMVVTRRFDDYWTERGGGSIRCMKIDVEGAELNVLQGMPGLLRQRTCDYFLIEVNDQRLREIGGSSAELMGLLRSHRYTLSEITAGGRRALNPGDPLDFGNILAEARS